MKTAKGTIAVIGLVVTLVSAGCIGSADPIKQSRDLVNKGLLQSASGNLDEAARLYRQAITKDPNNAVAYFDVGVIDQQNNNLAAAESDYRSALQNDPTFASAMFNLAIVRTAQGDMTEAAQLYKRAIKAKPDYTYAYLNLGFLYRDIGKNALGDRYLAKAIQLDASVASRVPKNDPIPKNTKPI